MPKYDDFGRPIYETAEEYNKAHGTGSHVRTYDSSEGTDYKQKKTKKIYRAKGTTGQYVNQSTVKKRKSMAVGIGICFLAIAIVFISVIYEATGNAFEFDPVYIELEENWAELEENWDDMEQAAVDVDGEAEYPGDDVTPLPEGFETFAYNGQMYSLPMTMEEVKQMGFTLEAEYDETYILPAGYEETLILNDEDGFAGMVRVSNYTDEDLSLDECVVDYFYMENPAAYEEDSAGVDFIFGGGLTFECTYEDLEEYFGIPYYHYQDYSEEGSYYDSYDWAYYGEDEIHYVSITFWNGVMADVGIEKRVMEQTVIEE